MDTAEKRLTTNPIYHAIATGITDNITTNFPWITTTLGTTNRNRTEFPVLQISRYHKKTINSIPIAIPQDIGRIIIDQDGIHLQGLTNYQNNQLHHYTTILLESPQMDQEINNGIWKMINYANQHQDMRTIMISPAEQAGVGPGLDDD